jgi:hypothetical protein
MQYEKDERDMVMLQHRFEIEYKDGKKVNSFSSREKDVADITSRRQKPRHW